MLLILIRKIIRGIESVTRPKKTKNKIDVNSVVSNSEIINQKTLLKEKIEQK